MASCADNSTECLLQQVVAALNEANSTYNWNLVTFAVTLVIGVIALWFALLPVLQGVVFPPDRVKYSKNAIGRWNKLVVLSWDWADMSFAALTQTPILDFADIARSLASLREEGDIDQQGNASDKRPEPSADQGAEVLPSVVGDLEAAIRTPSLTANQTSETGTGESAPVYLGQKHAVAAGWLSLLRHLGIEGFVFGQKNVRSSLATMIPADIPAAVAYLSIESAVLFAAMAGCNIITKGDKYPSARGGGFQLDFRDHPILGTVAAFANYGIDQHRIVVSHAIIVDGYRHSRGILQVGRVNIVQSVEVMASRTSKVFVYMPLSPWPKRLMDQTFDPLGYSAENSPRTIAQGVWLLYGDIPKAVRLFPSQHLRVNAIAVALACQTSFWEFDSGPIAKVQKLKSLPLPSCSVCDFMNTEYSKHSLLSRGQHHQHLRLGDEWDRRSSFVSWFAASCDTSPGGNSVQVHKNELDQIVDPDLEAGLHRMIILEKAEPAARLWLQDPGEFRALLTSDSSLRQTIVLQLLEIDYWLSKNRRLLPLDELPVQRRRHKDDERRVNKRMLVSNKNYSDIEEAFNRGTLQDWTTGNVNFLVLDLLSGDFNVAPWHGKYRAFGEDDEDELQRAPDANFWKETLQADKARFLKKNEIRYITLAERKGPFKGIFEDQKNGEALITREEEEGVETYLVFRAILFGALMDTGADTSFLLSLENAQQVVPML